VNALEDLDVLELVDATGEYCGRLLAGVGMDVVKVEPPSGAPSRHEPPFGPDGTSLRFLADNVGKRSRVAVVDDDVRAACADADVLVHTLRPRDAKARGLDFATLTKLNPRLVVCAITPFGQSGPWCDYEADDLVLMALGGSMAACGYGLDDPPLAADGDQAWRTASTYAAIAILAALLCDAGGQLIDVSAHECSASMTEWHVMTYLCTGQPMARFSHPVIETADGRRVAALTPDFLGAHVFQRLREMLIAEGVAGPLADPDFDDSAYRAAHYGEVHRAIKRLAAAHTGDELWRLGQSAGLPWGVIRSPEEVLEDRHLRSRGHWAEFDGLPYPQAPYVASASPFTFAGPPPRLGPSGGDEGDQA
jgi:benzylsuccinate CoA-transferase BbsE subunit